MVLCIDEDIRAFICSHLSIYRRMLDMLGFDYIGMSCTCCTHGIGALVDLWMFPKVHDCTCITSTSYAQQC